ncbi:hypothetical protein LP420_39105 [Massilia sp. B-10]|nr:hypothetical protein LP420_39105 [Massilia sp. B-10]
MTSGLAVSTASIRRRALDSFIVWCDERGLDRPQDITRPILQRYQGHLYHYRKANGAPLSFNTQATRLLPVVAFFKWCARKPYPEQPGVGPGAAQAAAPAAASLDERGRDRGGAEPGRRRHAPRACATGPCWKRCTAPASGVPR